MGGHSRGWELDGEGRNEGGYKGEKFICGCWTVIGCQHEQLARQRARLADGMQAPPPRRMCAWVSSEATEAAGRKVVGPS